MLVLWMRPRPSIDTSNKALITIRPSGKVHVPKFMEVKGQFVTLKAFYPLVLIVSYKFSIYFYP